MRVLVTGGAGYIGSHACKALAQVTDLAQAHVLALGYLIQDGPTTALNLGTGHGHSVLEVIAAAGSVAGHPIPTVLAPRRPGDPPVLTAAADRAYRVLGWQPRYTDLAAILRHAWNWHRKQAQTPDSEPRAQPTCPHTGPGYHLKGASPGYS